MLSNVRNTFLAISMLYKPTVRLDFPPIFELFWLKIVTKGVSKLKQKMSIFVRKQCFWPFSWKNRSFLGQKKILTVIFWWKLQKKIKKWLYQMKVGMFIGKVKKFGISWGTPHRMAAYNAKGGLARPPPPPTPLIGLNRGTLLSAPSMRHYLK